MKFDDIFGVHARALSLRSKRSEILAANLANADTPGFKARDFDFHRVLNRETRGSILMNTTHQRHIPSDNTLISPIQLLYRIPLQPSLDGNTVDTEREHIAFSTNAMEYQASLSFLNGKINGLRKALKGE